MRNDNGVRMMKIADIHTHIKYTSYGKIEAFLDELYEAGASDAALLALCAMPGYGIVQNLAVLRAKEDYKKIPIRAFGSFHETDLYREIPYEKQVEALLNMGCDGIKFIHMKPDCRKLFGKGINSKDYDKALSLLEERGTPVLMHSGDPENFWDITKMTPAQIARGWYYGDGTYLSREAHYAEVFEMLAKHPRLNLTLAHFFFLGNDIEEATRVMETYPNVKFDLTPGGEMYVGFSKNIGKWREFFITYQDRILFGTDSSNNKENNCKLYELVYTALTHDESVYDMPIWPKPVRGLHLPTDVVEKICYGNYHRFVGNSASVNDNLLRSCAERMLDDIKSIPAEEQSAAWLREFLGKDN